MDLLINRTRIFVDSSDILAQGVDALIHPTNTYLWFASGFSEILKRMGGEALERDAIGLGPVEIGQAVATKAGRLNCRLIIHVAAWGQDMMTDVKKIHQAVISALALASKNNCASVALPPVGAGVGRFPMPVAVEATFLSLIEHCLHDTAVREIHLLAPDRSLEVILTQLIQTASASLPDQTQDG
jgi:O-acetyl-ADP-ribose deacetylase